MPLGTFTVIFAAIVLAKASVKVIIIENWIKGLNIILTVSTIGVSSGLGAAHKSSTA